MTEIKRNKSRSNVKSERPSMVLKISKQSELAKKVTELLDKQNLPRYTDHSTDNILYEIVKECQKKLYSKFESQERKWFEKKLNSIKHTFFKNELRYYKIMDNFIESDRMTKFEWIDQQIEKLASKMLKNYILTEKCNFGNTQRELGFKKHAENSCEHFTGDLFRGVRPKNRSTCITPQSNYEIEKGEETITTPKRRKSKVHERLHSTQLRDQGHKRFLSILKQSNEILLSNPSSRQSSINGLDNESVGNGDFEEMNMCFLTDPSPERRDTEKQTKKAPIILLEELPQRQMTNHSQYVQSFPLSTKPQSQQGTSSALSTAASSRKPQLSKDRTRRNSLARVKLESLNATQTQPIKPFKIQPLKCDLDATYTNQCSKGVLSWGSPNKFTKQPKSVRNGNSQRRNKIIILDQI